MNAVENKSLLRGHSLIKPVICPRDPMLVSVSFDLLFLFHHSIYVKYIRVVSIILRFGVED